MDRLLIDTPYMPRNVYRGKRSYVTFPLALYEKIENLSEKETTSFSGMVVRLCLEAVAQRESKENNQ